jgi:glycosyltransferase involved in cell wall biosynthesis
VGLGPITTLSEAGTGRLRRALALAGELRRASHAGYRTVFLRYSRIAATVALLMRPLSRQRVLYWASGQQQHATGEESLGQRIGRAAQDAHFRWLVRRVDSLVTGPETMVDYMALTWRVPRERITLLYNDVDTERFRPLSPDGRDVVRARLGVPDDCMLVLFVHRVSPRRGSRLLVPLAEELRGRLGVAFRLVVVGAGPDEAYVAAAAAQSDAAEQVVLLGSRPNHELPELYAAADCLVMPSYDEGFPRVVLEAMACATPVVASLAGGTVDVLPPAYPHVGEPGDVDALVRGIVSLAIDPAAAKALGAQLRIRAVERYSTAVVARMYADVARGR